MNDTIIDKCIGYLDIFTKHLYNTSQKIEFWMCLASFELLIIFYLVYKQRYANSKISVKQRLKNETACENIDFDNIINSSFNAPKLYDELKVKCHPDRFVSNKEKYAIANSIFQEITKNKSNVKKLEELKELAKQKLNINF